MSYEEEDTCGEDGNAKGLHIKTDGRVFETMRRDHLSIIRCRSQGGVPTSSVAPAFHGRTP